MKTYFKTLKVSFEKSSHGLYKFVYLLLLVL
jgi:hypothetical protein